MEKIKKVQDTIHEFLVETIDNDRPFEIVRGATRILFGSEFVMHNGMLCKASIGWDNKVIVKQMSETEAANVIGALIIDPNIKIVYSQLREQSLLPDDLKAAIKYIIKDKYGTGYCVLVSNLYNCYISIHVKDYKDAKDPSTDYSDYTLPLTTSLARKIINWSGYEPATTTSTNSMYGGDINALLNAKTQDYEIVCDEQCISVENEVRMW